MGIDREKESLTPLSDTVTLYADTQRMEDEMKRYTVATRIQFEDGWTERVFGFVDEGISPSPRMDASDVSVVLINPSEVTCRGATHNYLTVSDDG